MRNRIKSRVSGFSNHMADGEGSNGLRPSVRFLGPVPGSHFPPKSRVSGFGPDGCLISKSRWESNTVPKLISRRSARLRRYNFAKFFRSPALADGAKMDSHDDSEINDYERVKDPADPRRCQGLILSGKQQGQCLMVAMVGTSYCKVHHGPSHVAQQKKKDNRLYNLGKYQARLERQADHDQIKSLREEIGILRIMIEERIIASSGSQVDLCIASGPISDMVMKVEKLVTSCNRSESQMGMLLDAAKAVQLAQEIVEAVADEIDDPDKLNRIADAVSAAVSRATTKAG